MKRRPWQKLKKSLEFLEDPFQIWTVPMAGHGNPSRKFIIMILPPEPSILFSYSTLKEKNICKMCLEKMPLAMFSHYSPNLAFKHLFLPA